MAVEGRRRGAAPRKQPVAPVEIEEEDDLSLYYAIRNGKAALAVSSSHLF